MAQIVTITNPLTGQPAQVDQLDHTAQQIDDGIARALPGGAIDLALSTKVNPNLLDNWYFGNPVNQRGFSGQNTSGRYFIDRWTGYNCSYINSILKIQKGMFDASSNGYIVQTVERNLSGELNGKVCTFSAIVNGDLISGTATYSNTSTVIYATKNNVSLFSQVSNGLVELVLITEQTDEQTVKAAKLELGTQQTLAHQDSSGKWVLNEIPDYGEQLIRCQRHLQQLILLRSFAVSLDENGGYTTFQLPVAMRETPVVTPIALGGIVGSNKSSTISEVRVVGFDGYNLTLMFKTSTTMAGNTAPVGYIYDTRVWLSAEL